MKKLLIICVLVADTLFASAQNGVEIFRFDAQQKIETNQSMIAPFYNGDEVKSLSYVLRSSTNVVFGGVTYSIKTGELVNGEDCEDYGFNVISIYRGNQIIFELKQPDMWTFTYAGRSMTDYRQYTDNRYFIPVTVSQQTLALLFVGWPYGGDMPLLSIVVLSGSDAKLVFNKNMDINSITKSGTSFSMQVQTNVVEYDESGKALGSPDIHQIYSQNGVLYYK